MEHASWRKIGRGERIGACRHDDKGGACKLDKGGGGQHASSMHASAMRQPTHAWRMAGVA
eukprot:269914-Chlamydomonas_euryale.AAC.1